MAHDFLKSLVFQDKNGNVIATSGRHTALVGGTGTRISVEDNKDIRLDAGVVSENENPAARQKYLDIINGVPPFSGPPYWLSTINKEHSNQGAFFLNVDACYHFGQFMDETRPENIEHTLHMLDTCPACDDCADYDELYAYMTMVKDSIDDRKDDIQQPEQLLDQYQALVERWNYVVQLKSWRYNAEATGAEVHASCKYTNHTDTAIPAGVVMTIDFTNTPPQTRAFIVDTAVKGSITRSDLLLQEGADSDSMSESVSESESSTEDKTISLTTLIPMQPGDGIRFYGGSLSPEYIGSHDRVSVNFHLTVPSGGIGNQNTSFNTNKMVVVEDWNQ